MKYIEINNNTIEYCIQYPPPPIYLINYNPSKPNKIVINGNRYSVFYRGKRLHSVNKNLMS